MSLHIAFFLPNDGEYGRRPNKLNDGLLGNTGLVETAGIITAHNIV